MFVEHKEAGEVVKAPTKVLKFSEAIRIGAAISGKASGVFVERDGRTCVQGAALLAIGRLISGDPCTDQLENHKVLREVWPQVPEIIYADIACRNNYTTATREQIADWLEAQGY